MAISKKEKLRSPSTQHVSYNPLHPFPDSDDMAADKENAAPVVVCPKGPSCKPKKAASAVGDARPLRRVALKPSSLQLRMRLDGPDSSSPSLVKERLWNPISSSSSYDAWDLSDSEAAPVSSWATLPNRSLMCRPLPLDVGRCTCIIVKECSEGMSLYSLYTNEGQGREDRKLAIARHQRRRGRSEFVIAQNLGGVLRNSEEGFLASITANLIGSEYKIYDQGSPLDSKNTKSKQLLGAVAFTPTVCTLTGSFRSMRAWISKDPLDQLKRSTSTSQVRRAPGLPNDWKDKGSKTHQLYSRTPYYNSVSKRYELDFKQRAGIQPSAKNFQLTMEEKGRQTILQLGRIGKSTYLMDFRYPLTGYQAFCICLTSVDSKLCCSF